jgi:trk system potassium uptake protein TrkA
MKVIVIGCGRLGAELATRMFQRGHEVVVVDSNPAAFNILPTDFQGRMIEGEALNHDVLHRAGIENADVLAVVTSSDALNLVVGHIGCCEFNVPNVVARNYDPSVRPLYETFCLQVVSSTSWGAQRLEEMIYQREIVAVLSAGNGEVDVYQFKVPEQWVGHSLGKLLNSSESIPVSVTRSGNAFLPDRDTILQPNDIIHVSATFNGFEELCRQMGITPKENK